MDKKYIITTIVFISLISLSYLFYQRQETTTHAYTFYGNVERHDVTLSFRVAGRIAIMTKNEGVQVEANTLLAKLDTDTFIAEKDSAYAKLLEAKARHLHAEQTYERRKKLLQRHAISKDLYDAAQALLDETNAQIMLAKAELEKASIALADTSLYSPTTGTVLARIREPGAIVSATEPVYTLSIDNPIWIRAYLNEPDLGHVHPGQKVLIYTDSRPKKPYHGYVAFISPSAEFTPKSVETTSLRTDLVYRFRVIVDKDHDGLRQGMPVSIVVKKT